MTERDPSRTAALVLRADVRWAGGPSVTLSFPGLVEPFEVVLRDLFSTLDKVTVPRP